MWSFMFYSVGCFIFAIISYRQGYHQGVKETERRWSDAVDHSNHHRVQQAEQRGRIDGYEMAVKDYNRRLRLIVST